MFWLLDLFWVFYPLFVVYFASIIIILKNLIASANHRKKSILGNHVIQAMWSILNFVGCFQPNMDT